MTVDEALDKMFPENKRIARIRRLHSVLEENPDGLDYDDILTAIRKGGTKIGHRSIVRDLEAMAAAGIAQKWLDPDDGRRVLWGPL